MSLEHTAAVESNGNYPGKGIGQPVGVAILGKGTVGTEVLRLIGEFAEVHQRSLRS